MWNNESIMLLIRSILVDHISQFQAFELDSGSFWFGGGGGGGGGRDLLGLNLN